MQINSIQASNQNALGKQSFGIGLEVKIPKKFYIPDITADGAKENFEYFLNQTHIAKPKTLLLRTAKKIGLIPDSLSFVNSPGYEHLKKFYDEGKCTTWIRDHINTGYDISKDTFNPQVPDIDTNNFHFFVLTGNEKNTFLTNFIAINKQIKQLSKTFINTVSQNTEKEVSQQDKELISGIAGSTIKNGAFDFATQSQRYVLDVNTPEDFADLSELLQQCLALDKQA